MEEVYANIPNFPSYQVSNHGNVKNITTGKVLSPGDNGEGYLYVNLRNKGKMKRFYVHRLVALVFVPNLNGDPIINHKDENTYNNHSDNLEWCTYKYNNNYGSIIEKRKAFISKHGTKILCVETGEIFPSIRAAARSVKRSHNNILLVINKPNLTCASFHWVTVD